MKTNKLIVALAMPLAFAACSNEEIIDAPSSPVVGANLVEASALTVDFGATESRGLWEMGNGTLGWSWIPEIDTNGESKMSGENVIADQIGLCWTGELADGTGSISSKVYSNYQFLHFGWLFKGAATASFDPCKNVGDAGYIKNGVQYNEVTTSITDLTWTNSKLKDELAAGIYSNNQQLNLATGVFKTDNKAIFGGSYVVYSPYNPQFADAASLPATSATVFKDVPAGDLEGEHMYKNTFLVGYAKDLVGGSQASKLSLDPLSSVVSVQLKSKSLADDNYFTTTQIEKIALWSENGFVSSVALDAAKIKTNGAKAGEALYVAGTKETSNTIVASLAGNVLVAESDAYTAPTKIYLPLLPTTAKNLKVILYANDGKIAVISLGKDYKFEAAKGSIVSLSLAKTDFKDTMIAVDQVSLEAALTAGATSITVAGDITLESNLNINADVTISGDDIIVPAEWTMTVAGQGVNAPWNAVIQSKVIVESEGCCASVNGILNAGVLSSFKDVDNMGTVNVQGDASFNGTLKNIVDPEDRNGNAYVNVESTGTMKLNGTFNNEADVLNEGNFYMNANSKVVNDGLINNKKMFTNNSSPANFVNNDTYVDMLGGLLNGMLLTNKGKYICDVDNDAERMNYALEKRTMVTTVRFVKDGEYDFSDYAGDDFSHLDFIISAQGITGVTFKGSVENVAADGTKTYTPAVLKIKNLTVNTTLGVNGGGTGNDKKLALDVKESVVVNGGSFVLKYPVLHKIGESLVLPDLKSGVFQPYEGAMLEIGNKTSKNGKFYIGKGCKATIGNNVKINVYGYVDKNTHSTAVFEYVDATGNGSVAGEVRCKDYNGAAGWTAGHAPVIDKYFEFK